jgi:hypothetical protein
VAHHLRAALGPNPCRCTWWARGPATPAC